MKPISIKYSRNTHTEHAYSRIVSTLFTLKERNGMNSYVFTGCESGVGNTTIALSIAAELADSGKKTLLVDCDFLKQVTDKRLFQYVDKGLSDYLLRDASLEEIVYGTELPLLNYISSGDDLTNPTMLLWSDNFGSFIDRVKQDFEFVIFDTAPLVMAPEVGVLAYLASGTILTVQFGKSRKSQIFASTKVLENMGANFLGVIVNKTPKSDFRIYQKSHGFSMVLKSRQESRDNSQ